MSGVVADPVTAAKLAAHEELCGQRHGTIEKRLGDIETSIRDAAKAAIGLAIAMIAFLGGQLWTMGFHPQMVSTASAQTVSR